MRMTIDQASDHQIVLGIMRLNSWEQANAVIRVITTQRDLLWPDGWEKAVEASRARAQAAATADVGAYWVITRHSKATPEVLSGVRMCNMKDDGTGGEVEAIWSPKSVEALRFKSQIDAQIYMLALDQADNLRIDKFFEFKAEDPA